LLLLLRLYVLATNPATPAIYTLSLHDALPISKSNCEQEERRNDRKTRHPQQADRLPALDFRIPRFPPFQLRQAGDRHHLVLHSGDRKSTRLNSSHVKISYAVFCLKKKKKNIIK